MHVPLKPRANMLYQFYRLTNRYLIVCTQDVVFTTQERLLLSLDIIDGINIMFS